MGLNFFSDLTQEEFTAQYAGRRQSNPSSKKNAKYADFGKKLTNAVEVNWVQKGKVSPVKNQGKCGSCWTFSATGAMESHLDIQFNEKKDLSQQQLLDCSYQYQNNGCKGGLERQAFEYVMDYGIMGAQSYPYMGREGQCRYDERGVVADILEYHMVHQYEQALIESIEYGPVSVAIHSAPIQHYVSGIFNEACDGNVDHAVLAVGYGPDYYLIKNSWGTQFGEGGYFRLARGDGYGK